MLTSVLLRLNANTKSCCFVDIKKTMSRERTRSFINFPRRSKRKNSTKYKKKNVKEKKKETKGEKDLNGNKSVISNLNVKNNLLSFGSVGSALASQNGTTLIEFTSDDPLAVDYEIFRNHNFPFENIILEGGGIKGLAYTGALMVSIVIYLH